MDKHTRDIIEGEVTDLLRGHDAKNFTVTITRRGAWWQVTVVDHDAIETDPPSDTVIGKGHTFAEAWQDLTPTWARG